MILTPLAMVALAQSDAVSLGRVFSKGEFLSYAVRSNLHAERRVRGLLTWMPNDLDINYDYTIEVESLKTDGIAVLRYKRPFITEIEGETFDRPSKTKKENVNYDMRLTMSPFNEVIDMKDLAAKKPSKPAKKGDVRINVRGAGTAPVQIGGLVGSFISEVYRLSLFVGGFESALDFAPRTTFDPVKVGDTWQRTVGYQPQKLKGKGDKQAVQRLDFTYTYKGLVDGAKGKKVMRVEGKLNFSTDISEFINQTYDVSSTETGLKSIPLAMDSTIEFDLDPKTHHTLEARATSVGNYKIIVDQYPDDPVIEEKITGRTFLKLAGRKILKTPAKK